VEILDEVSDKEEVIGLRLPCPVAQPRKAQKKLEIAPINWMKGQAPFTIQDALNAPTRDLILYCRNFSIARHGFVETWLNYSLPLYLEQERKEFLRLHKQSNRRTCIRPSFLLEKMLLARPFLVQMTISSASTLKPGWATSRFPKSWWMQALC